MITNALTKKLQKVKEEKVHLENQLEQEQEYIVNKLQKQLSTVMAEKAALEARLRDNTGAILQSIQQHLSQWTSANPSSPCKASGPSAAPAHAEPSSPARAPCGLTAAVTSSPRTPLSEHSASAPGASVPAVVQISDPAAAAASSSSTTTPTLPHLPPSAPVHPPPPHAVDLPALQAQPSLLSSGHSSRAESALDGADGAAPKDEWQRTHLLVSHLTREIDQLGAQHEHFKRECEEHRSGNDKLRVELSRLQHENAGLCHRVAREREIRAAAIVEKVRVHAATPPSPPFTTPLSHLLTLSVLPLCVSVCTKRTGAPRDRDRARLRACLQLQHLQPIVGHLLTRPLLLAQLLAADMGPTIATRPHAEPPNAEREHERRVIDAEPAAEPDTRAEPQKLRDAHERQPRWDAGRAALADGWPSEGARICGAAIAEGRADHAKVRSRVAVGEKGEGTETRDRERALICMRVCGNARTIGRALRGRGVGERKNIYNTQCFTRPHAPPAPRGTSRSSSRPPPESAAAGRGHWRAHKRRARGPPPPRSGATRG